MSLKTTSLYEFKNFRLDVAEGILLRDEKPVSITPKAFHLLKILVESHGHVVEKERLMREIWPDSFVEEGNLTFNTRMLRKTLGDDASEPIFIETVPRRGYRFVATVTEASANGIHDSLSTRGNLETPRPSPARGRPTLRVVPLLIVFAVLLVLTAWFFRILSADSAVNAPILAADLRTRSLPTSGTIYHAVISPDGKFVAYSGESGGKQNVWLQQLATSENIQIVPASDGRYFGFAFSNDGNSLYFVRANSSDDNFAAIYRVTTFGGIPVKVIEKAEGWISISSNDKQISFVRCDYKDDNFCSLMVADTDGTNERQIATRPRPVRISDNQFSPNGKSIAFATGQSLNGSTEFEIHEISLENGSEHKISAQSFFNIQSLKWLPNGSGLLFTAAANMVDKLKIWEMSKSGETKLLTRDSDGYSHLSLNKDASRMVVTRLNDDFQLYVSSSENLRDAKPLVSAREAVFAPDGKIVYSTNQSDIWSLNPDGSGQRQLTNNFFSDFSPRVSPDGRYIFFNSNRNGSNQIWRMNSDGSDQRQITTTIDSGYPRFVSPDGRWVYFEAGLDQTLWRVSCDGGDGEKISVNQIYSPAFSPNGELVAYWSRNKGSDNRVSIAVMSVADRRVTTVIPLPNNASGPEKIAWLDDATLSYVVKDATGNSLWKQSLRERSPHIIGDLGDGDIDGYDVSREGRVAFIRGKWIRDAVVIDGLK